MASAQIVVVVNDTRDLPDHDLADAQIDADALALGDQVTLRAAIQQICVWGGSYEILLGHAYYGLSSWGTDDACRWGDLDVHGGLLTDLKIVGVAGGSTLDASGFGAFPDRVFDVSPAGSPLSPNARVELEQLTLQRGAWNGGFGGGVRHGGAQLVLTEVTVHDCSAEEGGGIYSAGELSLLRCDVYSCSAGKYGGGLRLAAGCVADLREVMLTDNDASIHGGGISSVGASLVIDASSLVYNDAPTGAGLRTTSPTTILASSFGWNSATGSGGGLLAYATLSATRVVFHDNFAGSGAGADLTGTAGAQLIECTFDRNTAFNPGGGLANYGTCTAVACTFSRNRASSGGGIDSFGALELVNCTISSNTADYGAGLRFSGTSASSLSSCTFALNQVNNQGSGIWIDDVFGAPNVQCIGTLLADNFTGFGTFQNFYGNVPLQSLGGNFDNDGTCSFGPADISGSQSFPILGQVLPLALNGGPTETHALPPCSLAVEHGACFTAAGTQLWLDQRGVVRAPPCDVGAFEAPPGSGVPDPVEFCFGDGTGTPCPCGNDAPAGSVTGCLHSQGDAAHLYATGYASISAANLTLHCENLPANVSVLFFQGTSTLGGGLGVGFGDGLRCVGSPVIRLGLQQADALGHAQYPGPGQLPVAFRGMVTAGPNFYYQAWYRDSASFCTSATFNLSNGLCVQWCP